MGGAFGPRNVALDYVSGEYIMFIDSDDTYPLDACETLYNKALSLDPDYEPLLLNIAGFYAYKREFKKSKLFLERLLKNNHFRMAWHFFCAANGNASSLLQRNQIPAFHVQCLPCFPISRAKDAFPPFQQAIKAGQLLSGWFEGLAAFVAEGIFL